MKVTETALDWFNRVQGNRKRLFQNPIQFEIQLQANANVNVNTNANANANANDNANDNDNDNDNDNSNLNKRLKRQYTYQHQHQNRTASTTEFQVTPSNVIQMNSNLFFACPTTIQYYHQIQLRSKRWRKKQKLRRQYTHCTLYNKNNNHHHTNDDDGGGGGDHGLNTRATSSFSSLVERLNLELFQSAFLNPIENYNYNNKHNNNNRLKLNFNSNIINNDASSSTLSSTSSLVGTTRTGVAFMDLIFEKHYQQSLPLSSLSSSSKQQPSFTSFSSTQITKNNTTKTTSSSSPPPYPPPIIELIGSTSTGKTHILMALAANYVISTSTMSLGLQQQKQHQQQGHDYHYKPIMPFVIIIDPEHAMNVHTIRNYTEVAALRKWNKTQPFRYWYQNYEQQHESRSMCFSISSRKEEGEGGEDNEHVRIDQDISDSLNRIHIIHPKDFANGYIATLECIHDAIVAYEDEYCKEYNWNGLKGMNGHRNDQEKEDNDCDDGENDNMHKKNMSTTGKTKITTTSTTPTKNATITSRIKPTTSSPAPPHHRNIPIPPILILLDSIISAFDSIDKMHEHIGRGLSGRTEFIQQLNKICKDHNVVLVSTRTIRSGSNAYSSSSCNTAGRNIHDVSSMGLSSISSSQLLSSCDGWNKMVNGRITLRKVITGSKEEQDGYDFVAVMPLQRSSNSGGENNCNIMNKNIMEWNEVIPFSITDKGIRC